MRILGQSAVPFPRPSPLPFEHFTGQHPYSLSETG